MSKNLRQGREVIEDKNEYLENQSCRNNIRILGVEETEDEKSWDDTEKVVKYLLKKELNIPGEVDTVFQSGQVDFQGEIFWRYLGGLGACSPGKF